MPPDMTAEMGIEFRSGVEYNESGATKWTPDLRNGGGALRDKRVPVLPFGALLCLPKAD